MTLGAWKFENSNVKPFAFRESKSGITILTLNGVLKQNMFEWLEMRENFLIYNYRACQTNKICTRLELSLKYAQGRLEYFWNIGEDIDRLL